jgi:hypothetical protein
MSYLIWQLERLEQAQARGGVQDTEARCGCQICEIISNNQWRREVYLDT